MLLILKYTINIRILTNNENDLANLISPANPGAVTPGSSKKGGKSSGGNKDYNVEYAKSSRAMCRACDTKIMKVGLSYFIAFLVI